MGYSLGYIAMLNVIFFILFQECPEGVVQEDCFKDIYAKFFPHGSKLLLFTIYYYIY